LIYKSFVIIAKKLQRVPVSIPKGFGKNYFSLAAIQAYISLKKIVALGSSVYTLDGKPLRLKINSPPAS